MEFLFISIKLRLMQMSRGYTIKHFWFSAGNLAFVYLNTTWCSVTFVHKHTNQHTVHWAM